MVKVASGDSSEDGEKEKLRERYCVTEPEQCKMDQKIAEDQAIMKKINEKQLANQPLTQAEQAKLEEFTGGPAVKKKPPLFQGKVEKKEKEGWDKSQDEYTQNVQGEMMKLQDKVTDLQNSGQELFLASDRMGKVFTDLVQPELINIAKLAGKNAEEARRNVQSAQRAYGANVQENDMEVQDQMDKNAGGLTNAKSIFNKGIEGENTTFTKFKTNFETQTERLFNEEDGEYAEKINDLLQTIQQKLDGLPSEYNAFQERTDKTATDAAAKHAEGMEKERAATESAKIKVDEESKKMKEDIRKLARFSERFARQVRLTKREHRALHEDTVDEIDMDADRLERTMRTELNKVFRTAKKQVRNSQSSLQ